jgi:hypothetical protein
LKFPSGLLPPIPPPLRLRGPNHGNLANTDPRIWEVTEVTDVTDVNLFSLLLALYKHVLVCIYTHTHFCIPKQ